MTPPELDRDQKIAKGKRAERFKNDPLFVEASAKVEAVTVARWKAAKSVEERERCWAVLQALDALHGELEQFATDGFLAGVESKRITSR